MLATQMPPSILAREARTAGNSAFAVTVPQKHKQRRWPKEYLGE